MESDTQVEGYLGDLQSVSVTETGAVVGIASMEEWDIVYLQHGGASHLVKYFAHDVPHSAVPQQLMVVSCFYWSTALLELLAALAASYVPRMSQSDLHLPQQSRIVEKPGAHVERVRRWQVARYHLVQMPKQQS